MCAQNEGYLDVYLIKNNKEIVHVKSEKLSKMSHIYQICMLGKEKMGQIENQIALSTYNGLHFSSLNSKKIANFCSKKMKKYSLRASFATE